MRALGLLFLGLMLATPAFAQKDGLVVDLPGDVATMDPHLQWDTDSYTVYRNIFDNLVTRDATGKIAPQVATAWRYADDRTIVFDLRTDITFHDGSRLTPEDVVFSVQRIINPAFRSPQLSQFDQIVSAEVTGPAQVTLHTKTPYPALMAQLVKLSIVPKAVVEKLGDQRFNQEVVGSGPFRLRAWQRGVQTVLDANDAYWRGKPAFRSVTFRAVPDASTRIADLRTGRADITRGLSPDDAEALKSERALQLLTVPTERIAYMFVNAQAGPTKDKRVRQAIAMAVDRDTIITALQQGYAKPVNIVLTPANFGYVPDVKGWPHDPAKARALIKEAGAEGATLQFLTSPAYDRRLNEAVQQMLGEVGLKVDIVTMDQPTYLRRRQGTPEEAGSLSQGRWSCACQDADGVIFPLFRSGSIWSKFANPAFDAEVDAARTILDPGKRLEHYRRAFEILRDEVPGIGLFQDVAIYAARRELKWAPTANEAFFVMDMKWQP
ncbi:ABC transporter substrate-binding protein [Limobrevibacterium gyesilva]|uniref:ABC transporter substrate-binding protein n=1 Tax=Limobrevibacterium gyesilva TaxID=2991712 RepID=A0AA42CH34_9PROT|nr:ABC transporter substrate-binding protein [Limobrevibacterium gyesilva]MCW3474572.1 ABC transporter substrate-binding protein [Limobrevibacterium gyesilva]